MPCSPIFASGMTWSVTIGNVIALCNYYYDYHIVHTLFLTKNKGLLKTLKDTFPIFL